MQSIENPKFKFIGEWAFFLQIRVRSNYITVITPYSFVGARRFELPTSTSRTWRATNCAIPRNAVQKYSFIANLQKYIYKLGCVDNSGIDTFIGYKEKNFTALSKVAF